MGRYSDAAMLDYANRVLPCTNGMTRCTTSPVRKYHPCLACQTVARLDEAVWPLKAAVMPTIDEGVALSLDYPDKTWDIADFVNPTVDELVAQNREWLRARR